MISHHETALRFPCDFPIKIIGNAGDDFELAVLSIIRKHVSTMKENAIRSRTSKENNYIALTITIHATSQALLDTIYHELSACEHEILAL